MVCNQIHALLDDSILKGTMTYEKDFDQMVKYYFDGEGKAVRPLLVHKMAELVNFHLDVDKVKHQVGENPTIYIVIQYTVKIVFL